jgi:uncharacterized protein
LLKLDIAGIRKEVGTFRSFAFCTDHRKLDCCHDWICSDISVIGKLTNAGPYVSVQGQLESKGKFHCSRCLRQVILDCRAGFEFELQLDELANEEWIDISEHVREAMILSEPMKPLCTESCMGLCVSCGKDLNENSCDCEKHTVDPRLSKLSLLLNGKD